MKGIQWSYWNTVKGGCFIIEKICKRPSPFVSIKLQFTLKIWSALTTLPWSLFSEYLMSPIIFQFSIATIEGHMKYRKGRRYFEFLQYFYNSVSSHLKLFSGSKYDLIQKQPSCKKVCGPTKAIVKKMWNPRWQPRNGCDGRLIAKILIMTIQVNLCTIWHQIHLNCRY